MVALGVESESVICVGLYVPASGQKLGVAATGGGASAVRLHSALCDSCPLVARIVIWEVPALAESEIANATDPVAPTPIVKVSAGIAATPWGIPCKVILTVPAKPFFGLIEMRTTGVVFPTRAIAEPGETETLKSPGGTDDPPPPQPTTSATNHNTTPELALRISAFRTGDPPFEHRQVFGRFGKLALPLLT
jgi:hypothetical protein